MRQKPPHSTTRHDATRHDTARHDTTAPATPAHDTAGRAPCLTCSEPLLSMTSSRPSGRGTHGTRCVCRAGWPRKSRPSERGAHGTRFVFVALMEQAVFVALMERGVFVALMERGVFFLAHGTRCFFFLLMERGVCLSRSWNQACLSLAAEQESRPPWVERPVQLSCGQAMGQRTQVNPAPYPQPLNPGEIHPHHESKISAFTPHTCKAAKSSRQAGQ
eukprot:359226-Chlamydomonas_euryale.AAC.1